MAIDDPQTPLRLCSLTIYIKLPVLIKTRLTCRSLAKDAEHLQTGSGGLSLGRHNCNDENLASTQVLLALHFHSIIYFDGWHRHCRLPPRIQTIRTYTQQPGESLHDVAHKPL